MFHKFRFWGAPPKGYPRTYNFCLIMLDMSLSLLIPVLEAFAEEAAAIGLEVNWDKTKVQALGTQPPDTETLDVHGHQVAIVDEFVYLGALTHSSVLSSYDIHRRSGLTRNAMQKSDNCIWKSRLSLSTKLKLYNVCILPIMLYGSECWALSEADTRKVDALDQWCPRSILDIRWYQRVSNWEVRRLTEQPPLTTIIQKRRLMLSGHLVRMDESLSQQTPGEF